MVAKTRANAARFAGLSQIPFKAGHTGDPNAQIGYLDPNTLTVTEDGRALGEVIVTEPDAVARMDRGTWKWVSAELFLSGDIDEQTGESLGESFRGLAVVPHPRVKSIRGINPDASDVFAEEILLGQQRATAPDDGRSEMSQFIRGLLNLIGAGEKANSPEAKALEAQFAEALTPKPDGSAPEPPNMDSWPPEVRTAFAEIAASQRMLEQQNADLRGQNESLRKEFSESTARQFAESVDARIDAAVTSGRMLPAVAPICREILLRVGSFADSDKPIVFGEGDKKTEVPLGDAIMQLAIAATPSPSNGFFSESSVSEQTETTNDTQIVKNVRALFEQMNPGVKLAE